MTTVTYVSAPLLYALNVLDPYPWNDHVELVLRNTWGSALPEVKLAAENLHAVAERFERWGDVPLNELSRRRVQITLPGKATFHACASKIDPFGPLYNLLLPTYLTDNLRLIHEDSYDLVFFDVRAVGEVYQRIKNWTIGLHELTTDLIDADRIIRRTVQDLKRTYVDVLRSVYPSAFRIWQNLNYSKRALVSSNMLRSKIHPDDQDMIRTVLDQAAGGMQLLHTQRTLTDFRLNYEEE